MMTNNISDNTGEGIDRMTKKGLRWKWRWLMQCQLSQADPNDKRRLPCQTCFAEVKTSLGTWRFEAIDWHTGYEARVELDGNAIIRREDITSRAQAQQLSEDLLLDLAHHILHELSGQSKGHNDEKVS